MSHLIHLAKNKENIIIRSKILRLVREFFWSQDFLEIEVPLIVKYPGQEPHLSPMKVIFHDEKKQEYIGRLVTSPEYTLKKMLAVGFEKVFYISKVFRDYESFGGTHNPEFTMIEWYRAGEGILKLMEDCEKLFDLLFGNVLNKFQNPSSKFQINSKFQIPNNILKLKQTKWCRIHMRELWKKYVNVDLDRYLNKESMFDLCKKMGFFPKENESYEDLFYRIFLNKIEPELANLGAVFVHHYPAPMAGLSKIDPNDPGYAERFELYVNGLELANAFGELTGSEKQLRQLEKDQKDRKNGGKEEMGIDNDFVEAVGQMPESAGIALGIDRLTQIITGCKNIDNVITLPMSRIFYNERK